MIYKLIDALYEHGDLPENDLIYILEHIEPTSYEYLREKADKKRRLHYDDTVFMRGLIEFTNFCAQDCSYCGIRASNSKADRYRLTQEEILSCCAEGYRLGYRTYVLQGGEDPWFTDDKLCGIIGEIKEHFPETAITLSVGERSRESYQRLFDAGADRYLLRHETASKNFTKAFIPA